MSYFSPVDSILNSYHEKHDLRQVPILLDNLRPIFEEIGYVDKIIWEKFDFKTQYILAQIKTYRADMGLYQGIGNYARIQISDDQNLCWTRFILCKEMYHCILDAEENARVTDTQGLLKISSYLTNSFLSLLADEDEKYVPYDTEIAAEVMALETLFPYELRRHFCDGYDDQTITDHQLALRFRIPQVYVPMAMTADYFSAVCRGRA